MRLLALIALAVIPFSSAFAMIRPLPVSELVAAAEYIIIADVVSITEDTAQPRQPPIRNELRRTRVLKGSLDASKTLVLRTYFKPGQKAREDSLVFPAAGRSVLLFLKTAATGELVPVNGIQGLWPLEAGTRKPLGMGFRYSINEIERLIAAEGNRTEKEFQAK